MAFNNILIVRTDRIGDVVLTTPAIKALRKAFPAARLSILVAPGTCDLVNGNPYIDAVLMDDRKGANKGLLGFWKLIREIQDKKFDLAVIFHTKRRYNLLCAAAGIPVRLGYRNAKFGFLLTRPVEDRRHLGQQHEARYCLDLLKTIGVEAGEADLFVPVQKTAEEWVQAWLQENNLRTDEIIAIHPGASDPAKCWPPAHFASLISRLADRYTMKIVLIGASQTASTAQDILKQLPHSSQIIDLTGKTSLAQTVSLLRRSRLLISNDSGPVHVAAGVGTAVISLFMRNQPGINSERWKPLGPRSYILDNKAQPGAVGVDDVLNLVEQIFQKNSQYEIF